MPTIGSMQRAMSNAGVEVAGVQQQASSPIELAARSALERGDVDGALQQYRRALASAGDDVTRARLQRQIDSLEASQAAQAAAAAQNTQNTQAGSVPITQVQAASESSLRRSRAAPARATNRTRSSTAGSADNYGSLAY